MKKTFNAENATSEIFGSPSHTNTAHQKITVKPLLTATSTQWLNLIVSTSDLFTQILLLKTSRVIAGKFCLIVVIISREEVLLADKWLLIIKYNRQLCLLITVLT